jgi:hypothetical protein
LSILGLLFAAPARPQDPAVPDEIRNDTDPTKPVLLSVRDEYYNLRGGPLETALGPQQNVFILRADRLVLSNVGLPGNSRGFLLRADLPVVTAGIGQTTRTGLGDLYAQALVVPRFNKNFTIAWGTGMVFPTATNSVGFDKFQLAPAVAPVWFFGRLKGFAFVKFQDFVSVAGDANRPDINYLLITPTILWRLTREWWIVADSESRTDWEHGNTTSFKSGLQIGKMLSPRFGMWVKSEIPWGPNRLGSWTLKVTAFWTRY